jgi:hypothetical protein
MSKLGKIWAGAVAYVSLLFGAGLSVAGNLADTYRIRGHAVDGVDIALAIGPPIATLLVAEMFVSAWPRKISIQSIRWFTTVTVGALATIVSWSHINELLAARGQNHLVAILWPLAIDGVAIMAMAKILVTRGHVAMANPPLATDGQMASEGAVATNGQMAVATASVGQWEGPVATEEDVAISEAAFRGQMATEPGDVAFTSEREYMATQPFGEPEEDVRAVLDHWEAGHQAAIDDLGRTMADEAEAFVNAGAAIKHAEVKPEVKVPEQAREFIANMLAQGAKTAEIDEAVQEMCMVSPRTARRYRGAVEKQVKEEGK